MDYSAILDLHPSGTAVTLKQKIKHPVNAQILLGYKSDKELTLADRDYLVTRPILPMPVMRSPLLVLFMHNDKETWFTRYTDSIEMLSLLRSIQSCYSINPHLPYYEIHAERIEAAIAEFRKNTVELENAFFATTEFPPTRVEEHTIRYINLFEICLYKMFNLEASGIVLSTVLTPLEFPAADVLNAQQKEVFMQALENFFLAKQYVLNAVLKRDGLPEEVWFAPIDLNDQLYRGYLPLKRAQEYAAFFAGAEEK